MFDIMRAPIEGAYIISPRVFSDNRGYFFESFNAREMSRVCEEFVQDNQSYSKKGVLRGMHYQTQPQAKLVRVITGSVQDVIIDMRPESSTYMKYYSIILSEDNRNSLYIPPLCAHGFLVLSEYAQFQYKCSDFYRPECEAGIKFDDPQIGIKWNFEPIIVAKKDMMWPALL